MFSNKAAFPLHKHRRALLRFPTRKWPLSVISSSGDFIYVTRCGIVMLLARVYQANAVRQPEWPLNGGLSSICVQNGHLVQLTVQMSLQDSGADMRAEPGMAVA